MLLDINDFKTIGDMQDHFNKCFPDLRMEFYYHPHKEVIDPSVKIGEVTRKHEQGKLEIMSWHQAGKVQHIIRQKFGLNAQIFRFENGTWIPASYHDTLSLNEQHSGTHLK